MVVGDMLAGGGGDEILGAGNGSLPISSKVGDRMTALVLYGDPRHIPNESFDVGNNNVTGVSEANRAMAYHDIGAGKMSEENTDQFLEISKNCFTNFDP